MPKNKTAEQAEILTEPTEAPVLDQTDEAAVVQAEPAEASAAPVAPKDPFEDRELLYIPPPMSNSEEKDVVIIFNGRIFTMPKGGTYKVPKCVAAEYRRSQNARARGMKRKTDMIQKEQKVNAAADAVINGRA